MATHKNLDTVSHSRSVRLVTAAVIMAIVVSIGSLATSAPPASASTGSAGWTKYTLSLNKAETRYIARNGFWAGVAAGFIPNWAARLVGVAYAGWTVNTAMNAESDHKCLKFTYYYGWSMLYPGEYSGGYCR